MELTPKRCVVTPVNQEDESFDSVAMALEMVARPGDVQVVHVLPPMDPDDLDSVWSPPDPEIRKEAARRSLLERLQRKLLGGVSTHVLQGSVGTEVAAFARASNADLVIVPSHHQNILTRLFSGSISEDIIRYCRCPVLVLPE